MGSAFEAYCVDVRGQVVELRALSDWSEGHVWVSPEMHGALTGVFKNQARSPRRGYYAAAAATHAGATGADRRAPNSAPRAADRHRHCAGGLGRARWTLPHSVLSQARDGR